MARLGIDENDQQPDLNPSAMPYVGRRTAVVQSADLQTGGPMPGGFALCVL